MSRKEEILKALSDEDARALLRIAADAAQRIDNAQVIQILAYINSIAEVMFSTDLPTARLLLRRGRYYLEFNPEFVRRHVETAEELLHVLMHEILHKVRGDLTRPMPPEIPAERARKLSNFAADMLINADLERYVMPTPRHLLRLYDPGAFPCNLLLPPRLLLMDGHDLGLSYETLLYLAESRFSESGRAAGIKDFDAAEVARVYLSAWTEDISFEALVKALHRFMPEIPDEMIVDIVWLGDHGCEGA